jgi:hypothetical protein
MYIELKTHAGGHDDKGPARIGLVTFNRTMKTLTYQGKKIQKGGTDSCANYHDVETGEGYWISGPKKNGEDRYPWARNIPVAIDEDVREKYWMKIRNKPERVKEKYT